jgi:hypothetical protein
MLEHTLLFMSGAIAFGFALCGIGFLRLWVRSGDRLFLGFAGAFWLLMLPSFSALLDIPDESRSWVYLARIAAYLLIIASIAVRNHNRLERSR